VQIAGIPEEKAAAVLKLLVWFGFLGVASPGTQQVKYSYIQVNMRRIIYR
jgi:hypothetical protein